MIPRHSNEAVRFEIDRRVALKYLLIGVGSTIAAACGGDDDGSATSTSGTGTTTGTTAGSGTPTTGTAAVTEPSATPETPSTTATSEVVDRAFAAYVIGTWDVEATRESDSPNEYVVDVRDETYEVHDPENETRFTGSWEIRRGTVRIRSGPDDGPGLDSPLTERGATLSAVPDDVDFGQRYGMRFGHPEFVNYPDGDGGFDSKIERRVDRLRVRASAGRVTIDITGFLDDSRTVIARRR